MGIFKEMSEDQRIELHCVKLTKLFTSPKNKKYQLISGHTNFAKDQLELVKLKTGAIFLVRIYTNDRVRTYVFSY